MAFFSVNDCLNLLTGMLVFLKTGKTPEQAYQAMIRLFCQTRGCSNDFLHAGIRILRPPYVFPTCRGVLGNLSSSSVRSIGNELRKNGYYVFPEQLPPEIVNRLLDYALTAPCRPIGKETCCNVSSVYPRQQPQAEIYRFEEPELLQLGEIQQLMGDFSLLSVAQDYLGSQPLLDIVALWWSTSFSKSASSGAAQMYHFDMDRIKWLKFFFYLTDVTADTGPHCFVAGSHRRFKQPAALLRRGYARIADDEMASHYRKQDFREITGPHGTILAVDTRGFHKGKVPETGDRLILQLQFCDSLLGGSHARPRIKPCHPRLRQLARDYPRTYSKYIIPLGFRVPA